MKRFVITAVCFIATLSLFVSCEKKPQPDAKCEITGFSLTAALNSVLKSDINGVIDQNAKTITLTIPSESLAMSYIPTFTATEHDVVKVGGTPATSGETAVAIADGTKVSVSDEVSVLDAEYTIALKENDGAVELSSVVFKKADNADLTEDVAPAAIEEEMIVRVPAAAFRKELKMTVTAGKGDVIKVNDQEVASGSAVAVDTQFPIDITVSDPVAGKSASYVVKVGKILGYVVSKLATYTEGASVPADFYMAVNPNDNLPYFAYTRKIGEEKYNGVSIAKWDGSAFALVGPSGVADNSARAASKPKVAFAKDGGIYAYYLAGDVASKPTVRKLDGSWTVVGTAGITAQNCNSSYLYPFFVHPASGNPMFFWNGNTKNQPSYRTMNFGVFTGGTWNTGIASGVPAYGSGSTASSGMYYTSSAVFVGDKVFMVSSLNEFGYYVHEVSGDGALTAIVSDFKPAGAPYGLPGNLQMSATDEGALYVFAADASANVMQVYSVDQSDKSFKPYGASFPVTIASNGNITEKAGFAVSKDGKLMVAAINKAEKIPAFYYLNDSMQWDAFTLDAPAANTGEYYAAFGADGKGYIAYLSAAGIELYGVALEADILPSK